MINNVEGPNFTIIFEANELTSSTYIYDLPKGYSINIINITSVSNIWFLNNITIRPNTKIVFPVVNSKSPSTITLNIADISKRSEIRFTIEKFGQIPDPHYFDKAFEPILVTGEDGNKYNVIPSYQFK